MFVGIRELRMAKGRFTLIVAVAALIAVLVTFLSGLTSGLAAQNVSAITSLPGKYLAFSDAGGDPSFDRSTLTKSQVQQWQQADDKAQPLGISRGRVESADAPIPVAVLGGIADLEPGTIAISSAAESKGVVPQGNSVTLDGQQYRVATTTGDDWYAHSPVIWMNYTDWVRTHGAGSAATVMVLDGQNAEVAQRTGTQVLTIDDSLSAIGSYQAENSSLTVMTVMLMVISAVVMGAFFAIWNIARRPDVAVLKALGASTFSLLADAMGQALVVLGLGVGSGVAMSVAASQLVGDLPYVVDMSTTVIPALGLIGLGVLGAALSLRFVITASPLTALGGAR